MKLCYGLLIRSWPPHSKKKPSWPQKCFAWRSTPKADVGKLRFCCLKTKPSLPNMCFKLTWNISWIQLQLPLQVFPLLQCQLCPGWSAVVFLYFFLLKKKPTQEMTISSYTKSGCVVHIAGSLSFNSNASCQMHRYQTCSHFSCSGKQKRERRSADCMQAFSNLPALSVPPWVMGVSQSEIWATALAVYPSTSSYKSMVQTQEKKKTGLCQHFQPKVGSDFQWGKRIFYGITVDTISTSRNWHRLTSLHQALGPADNKTTGAHNVIRKHALDQHNYFPCFKKLKQSPRALLCSWEKLWSLCGARVWHQCSSWEQKQDPFKCFHPN